MANQPHPPRRVSLADLLPYTLLLADERRRARSGLVLLVAVGVAAVAIGWGPVRAFLALVGLPPALFLLAAPLRLAYRLGWAGRHGVMASAVVADRVDDEVVCQVQGPRGSFRTALDLDGLPEPQPAERLLVVLHPERDEVLWCLGPTSA